MIMMTKLMMWLTEKGRNDDNDDGDGDGDDGDGDNGDGDDGDIVKWN